METYLSAPLPEQTMREKVLQLVNRDQAVASLRGDAAPRDQCALPGTTIVNVDVPSHRRPNEVTHHRCALRVVGREFAPFDFHRCVVWSIYSPAGTRLGPAARRLVLLLWVAVAGR